MALEVAEAAPRMHFYQPLKELFESFGRKVLRILKPTRGESFLGFGLRHKKSPRSGMVGQLGYPVLGGVLKEAVGPDGTRHVAATAPRRRYYYRCPRCEGQVFVRRGHARAASFAHYEDEGVGCDYYQNVDAPPSLSGRDLSDDANGSDDSERLTMLLRVGETSWSLALGIDEMSVSDARKMTMSSLRLAELLITSGGKEVGRINALAVRSGVERADVEVPPSTEPYRFVLAGQWPALAFTSRRMYSDGLSPHGTLFRERWREWSRVPSKSRVLWGQSLYVVASTESPPPSSCVARTHKTVTRDGREWQLSLVALPSEPIADVESWLSMLGHTVERPRWGLSLISPPRGFTVDQRPQLYAGDPLFARIDAPGDESDATLSLETRLREVSESIPDERVSYAVARPPLGPGVLRIDGEDDLAQRFDVVARLSVEALRAELDRLPRLVVRMGARTLGAAQAVQLSRIARSAPATIETGADGARVSLRIRSVERQRVIAAVTCAEASRILTEALATEHVEAFHVDAGPLGTCEVSLLPIMADKSAAPASRISSWLAAAARAESQVRRPLSPWTARAASQFPGLKALAGTRTAPPLTPSIIALLRRRRPEKTS